MFICLFPLKYILVDIYLWVGQMTFILCLHILWDLQFMYLNNLDTCYDFFQGEAFVLVDEEDPELTDLMDQADKVDEW